MEKMIVIRKGKIIARLVDRDLEIRDVEYTPGSSDGSFFLRNSHVNITIEDTTLFDLVKQLTWMNDSEIDALEVLSDANIKPFIDNLKENVVKSCETSLKGIEVYKQVELDNYETCDDVYKLTTYTSAHGIGDRWDGVDENVKGCNTYAIEFTPWQDMFNLPITIAKECVIERHTWKVREQPENFILEGTDGSFIDFGPMKKTCVLDTKDPQMITYDMTMREFFHGLFDELCFFGSPQTRSDKQDELVQTMKDVDEQMK